MHYNTKMLLPLQRKLTDKQIELRNIGTRKSKKIPILLNKMDSTLFTRLDAFMKYKGLNDNRITVQAKIAVGTLGTQRRTGKGRSYDSLVKILETYPELNPSWLILGTGEMLIANEQQPVNIEDMMMVIKNQEATIRKQQEKIDLLISQLDYIRTQISINQEYLRDIMHDMDSKFNECK